MVFWGNFRYFRRFQGILRCVWDLDIWSKIRGAYRSHDKHSNSSSRSPQSPEGIQNFKRRKQAKKSWLRANLSWLRPGFGRMVFYFGRMDLKHQETCSKRLESPNAPPFGRMRYHSGELTPQTARLVFFASLFPRAFRAFYPFHSLAYKYPLVSE